MNTYRLIIAGNSDTVFFRAAMEHLASFRCWSECIVADHAAYMALVDSGEILAPTKTWTIAPRQLGLVWRYDEYGVSTIRDRLTVAYSDFKAGYFAARKEDQPMT